MQEDFNTSHHYNLTIEESSLNNSFLDPLNLGNQQQFTTEPEYVDMTSIPAGHSVCQGLGPENFQANTAAISLPLDQHSLAVQNLHTDTSDMNLSTQQHMVHSNASGHQANVATSAPVRREPGPMRYVTPLPYSQSELNELLEPYETEHTLATRPIPEYDNWPGDYGFDITLDVPEQQRRDNTSVYSASRRKLYVAKDSPCCINFMASSNVPDDARIRAMGMFVQRENGSEVVKRCFNCTMVDYKNGLRAPDHLIRCECDQVFYEKDQATGRRSVVVPYERPQVGQNYSVYIFSFACYGSCVGGLNRRPFRIIFTLESGNIVVGRHSLEVKICASPSRDCQNDDKRMRKSEPENRPTLTTSSSKKRKKGAENSHLVDVLAHVSQMKCTEVKEEETQNPGGPFMITVPDRETYEFLNHARMLYTLEKSLLKYSPYIIQYLTTFQKQKKKKKDDEN